MVLRSINQSQTQPNGDITGSLLPVAFESGFGSVFCLCTYMYSTNMNPSSRSPTKLRLRSATPHPILNEFFEGFSGSARAVI